ncbi:MAG: DoxX family protein [bacterium]|nr:DoxX family protein [bacterium]
MFKKVFSCSDYNLAMLLGRIGAGSVFLAHGLQKLGNLDGTSMFMASLGLPSFFGPFIMAVEVLGGLALIVGAFSRIAGLVLAVDMAFAICLVKFSKGFIGGYEFELLLLLVALGIHLAGPGKYAVGKDWW